METTSTLKAKARLHTGIMLLLTLLGLMFSKTSSAWRVDAYSTSGCAGATIKVHAVIVASETNIYYHWQYKDNSAVWKCFVNGTNNINGTNFTVSGVTTSGGTTPADLSIANSTTALENVQVRIFMGLGGDPCNGGVTVENGDNSQLTKMWRIHVLSGADCGGTTPGCIGNVLSDANGYYGGFESGANNFTASTGKSEYLLGTANNNQPGHYMVQNNPYAYLTSFGQFAPHSGNNQMVVIGQASNLTSKKVWYKTVNVTPGATYAFCAWVARVDGSHPEIQLNVNGTNVAFKSFNDDDNPGHNIGIGEWVQICGSYTVPSGVTSLEIAVLHGSDHDDDGSIDDDDGSVNDDDDDDADNLSLDDICFRMTGTPPDCSCTNSTNNLLINGSFENGTTGYTWSGGNLTTGTGYVVCGNKNAFLDWTSGTAKVWQQVNSIAPGSTVTFKGWAGTHTAGINCSPKLILAFYNSSSALISSTSVTVDKDVDQGDHLLKEYTITAIAPAGTVYTRVEADINCNTLKLDALCLTAIAPTSVLNPDINVTFVNVPVPGNVNTNDIVPTGTTYGTPIPASGNPAGGVITMNSNGTYTFTSPTVGVYVYNVPVCVPGQPTPCPTSLLTITVLGPNSTTNPPVANTDIATTLINTPVTLNSLANDAAGNPGGTLNPASVTVTIAPLHGTTSVNAATGAITYTPTSGFTGMDTLTYRVCDNGTPSLCATAKQIITVKAAGTTNTTIAADDFAITPFNTAVSGNVKTNDSDPEGNTQTVTAQTTTIAGKGTLVLSASGAYTFTPVSGFSGPVSFTYTTCDNGTPQACASATLYILVRPGSAGPAPDLTPRINLNPNNIIGQSTMEITIQINEIANVPTDGSAIILYVDKLNFLSNFSFNSSQTTNLAGQPIQNNLFTIDTSNAEFYIITTHAVFQNSLRRLAFTVTVSPGQTKGSTPVNVFLQNGSGGETNYTNNSNFTILNFSF